MEMRRSHVEMAFFPTETRRFHTEMEFFQAETWRFHAEKSHPRLKSQLLASRLRFGVGPEHDHPAS
jgi:hypothetical protein